MSNRTESKRASLRIKRVEADKLRKKKAETRANYVRARKAAEALKASQSSSSDKENQPNQLRPKKLAVRKSNVKVDTPTVQDSSSSTNPPASSKKPTPPKKPVARKTTAKSNVRAPPPQNPSSSSSSASKRPLSSSADSEAGPSEPKRAASTSNPPNVEVREKKPYTKYDYIPEEYLEPNWSALPLVRTTDASPILFKQQLESIVVGERWEEDKVVYSDPPSRPKAVIPEPEPTPSPNEHTQLIHALQHFVHTLNKQDTDAFEKLVDEIDNVVDVMQSENKTKSLNLYAIQFDTHLYHTFSCMKPKQLCQGEGIFVRMFFELLKKSIGVYYTKYENTKEDMMLALQQNITPLKMYGEKMVIPCDKVIHHIKRLAEKILNESRAQF